MLKYLGALLFLQSFIFLSEASALMRIDLPKSAKQGDVVMVFITDPDRGPHEVHFYPVGWSVDDKFFKAGVIALDKERSVALIPIAADEKLGLALVSVFSLNNDARTVVLQIKNADFPISSGTSFVGDLKGKLKDKFDAQKDELKKMFALVTPQRFWEEDLKFSASLKEMAITSPFGQIRHKVSRKEGKWDVNHYGADLHADVGTPVFAVESGIVRIADNFLAEGTMVLIDHGYGLISLYFHLSKLEVKRGDIVKKGHEIARSGQTGAVVGPHLHFEMRLRGVAVSPWNFMPEPPAFEQKAVAPPTNKSPAVKHSKKRGVK